MQIGCFRENTAKFAEESPKMWSFKPLLCAVQIRAII